MIDASAHADMLCGRALKNARRLRGRLGRETTAFRVYDWDIPEVRAAVDWLDGALVVNVFARAQTDAVPEYERRLADALADAFGVPRARAYTRRRTTGAGVRYARQSRETIWHVVHESGLRFACNLTDYVDHGLFLDHRPLRKWCQVHAASKDVLNLFSYSGSLSVSAAAGGARSVTSVEVSDRYSRWEIRNFDLNGLPPSQRVVQDASAFLEHARPHSFDLIIVDPPSRSTVYGDAEFDVQRDHPALLDSARRLLRPGGVLWFSTNHQDFDFGADGAWEECTEWTVPEDFRHAAHRSWRLSS